MPTKAALDAAAKKKEKPARGMQLSSGALERLAAASSTIENRKSLAHGLQKAFSSSSGSFIFSS